MIKLEVGKCYLTRSGEKVGPLIKTPDDVLYLFSVEEPKHINWKWTEIGRYYWNDGETDYDLVTEASATIPSPIQEVTKKQLVAGQYGIVNLSGSVGWMIYIPVSKAKPDELRQAATTLIEIAEFLSNDQP